MEICDVKTVRWEGGEGAFCVSLHRSDERSVIRLEDARGRHCELLADELKNLEQAFKLLRRSLKTKVRPRNAGKPWTAEADEELKAAFEEGADYRALASRFQRTPVAVHARLTGMGLVDPLLDPAPVGTRAPQDQLRRSG